ncbi:MAG TPA: M48 family metallopeptidase [Terriglobales bacterium]|jgi:Zn-dependent protease with chaperone function
MRVARSSLAKLVAIYLVLLLAVPQPAYARFQPTTGSDMYSVDQEIQIGRQAAQETEKKEPILPDNSELTQYVRQLGQRLTAVAPGYKWPYEFHVVNTKDVNAFALPGGPMFVNIGAIMAADHENELAGVMAHEISHVVQRHATRAATKQQKYQVGLGILGAILGARGGALSNLAALGAQFAVGSVFLKNSREAESEADLLGTDIMYDAGYDPRGLAAFFEKLEAMSNAGPEFLSDHPNPGNRLQAVEKEVGTLQPKQFRPDSADWVRIKQMVGTLKQPGKGLPASSGAQAAASGSGAPSGVAPSGQFQTLNHNLYSVQYPSNWQVFGDQQSDVTIAPQGGVGQDQNGQSAVAYGVIISTFEGEQRGGSSSANGLDDATHQLIDQLRQGNPDMRQTGSDESIRVNNQPAKSVEFTSKSPIQGQKERDWLVTVQRPDGNISYLVFIAPDKDFRSLRPAFEQMLRTFHVK